MLINIIMNNYIVTFTSFVNIEIKEITEKSLLIHIDVSIDLNMKINQYKCLRKEGCLSSLYSSAREEGSVPVPPVGALLLAGRGDGPPMLIGAQ